MIASHNPLIECDWRRLQGGGGGGCTVHRLNPALAAFTSNALPTERVSFKPGNLEMIVLTRPSPRYWVVSSLECPFNSFFSSLEIRLLPRHLRRRARTGLVTQVSELSHVSRILRSSPGHYTALEGTTNVRPGLAQAGAQPARGLYQEEDRYPSPLARACPLA